MVIEWPEWVLSCACDACWNEARFASAFWPRRRKRLHARCENGDLIVAPHNLHGNKRRHWIRQARGKANHARKMMSRRDALAQKEAAGIPLSPAEWQEWQQLSAALATSVHGFAYQEPRSYDRVRDQAEIALVQELMVEILEEERSAISAS